MPNELIYPIPLKEENVYQIFEISDIVSYVREETIIFVIKVPLTTKEKFETYDILPIPQSKDSNIVMITPVAKTLLISDARTEAALINDLKECKTIMNEKICKSCETEIFLKNRLINSCDYKVINQELEI